MEASSIAWTDSTFSPWEGCTKASSGCLHCYAETRDKRLHQGESWGPGAPRKRMSDNYWMQPLKWNRKAAANGKRLRVFPSLCDIFDSEAPQDQRNRFWELTKVTPNLIWLMLTKRPQNFGAYLPRDWGSGYRNVWLGVTAENGREAGPRIGLLRETLSVGKFVSAEPLLEDLGELDLCGIDWMIVGGESGRGARPMSIKWADRIFQQCRAQRVPFFMKQLGHVALENGKRLNILNEKGRPDSHAGDMEVWPSTLDHLKVRELPHHLIDSTSCHG